MEYRNMRKKRSNAYSCARIAGRGYLPEIIVEETEQTLPLFDHEVV